MGKIITSYGISKMTGRVGDAVFSIEQGGVGMRNHNPISKQPFTAAQVAREVAFSKANQTWTTIGRPEAEKWRAWGRTQKVREITGEYRNRAGKDCFTGLYAKMLQVDPNAAIPSPPPKGSLIPDDLGLTVTMGPGRAIWSAIRGNRDGLTTELMAQELPSEVALPVKDGYKTLAFHAFVSGAPAFGTLLDAGYWAFAAQTVEIATGRTVGFAELGFGTIALSMVEGGADDADEDLPKAA